MSNSDSIRLLVKVLEMSRQTKSIIENGMIIPPTHLEVIASDHCNISCAQCNHGSPIMKKWNADPDDVFHDLSILAKIYRPRFIKVIGGEPLLHPRLGDLIDAIRRTRISDQVTLVTNGILLARMDPSIWGLITEIEISKYPGANLSNDLLEKTKETAVKHGVDFTLNTYTNFRRTFSKVKNNDPAFVNDVFRACKMANLWGCHSVYKGRIYRCPQSGYALTLAGIENTDGIAVEDRPEFQSKLLEFVNSPEPLKSCSYCVGSSGLQEPHRLLARQDWSTDLEIPHKKSVDCALLEKNLQEIAPLDDCKTLVSKQKGHLLAKLWRNTFKGWR